MLVTRELSRAESNAISASQGVKDSPNRQELVDIFGEEEANAIILLTIGFVCGGYSLAKQLHISGPLAMVTAGIYVSCHLHHKIPELHFHDLKKFWEVIDELLNAILFLLIGFDSNGIV